MIALHVPTPSDIVSGRDHTTITYTKNILNCKIFTKNFSPIIIKLNRNCMYTKW